MNTPTLPHPTAATADTLTLETPLTERPAGLVVTSALGIELRILGRGHRVGTVLTERVCDEGRRVYAIADLRCAGGRAAIEAELARVTAPDCAL